MLNAMQLIRGSGIFFFIFTSTAFNLQNNIPISYATHYLFNDYLFHDLFYHDLFLPLSVIHVNFLTQSTKCVHTSSDTTTGTLNNITNTVRQKQTVKAKKIERHQKLYHYKSYFFYPHQFFTNTPQFFFFICFFDFSST